MSSRGMLDADTIHGAMIVPHRTLPASVIESPTDSAVRCPRCQELVTLPDWAADGDLTECCGLLLRVSCDGRECQLERL